MDKLWAVARSTFLQVIRSRVAGGFIIFTLAMMVVLPAVAQSPAQLDMLKTYSAYSLGLGSFALSILTIITGCQLLCDEIENHQIYTPLTKPVSRPVYLMGRWTGLMMSQALLVIIFGASFYGTTCYLRAKCDAFAPNHVLSRQFFTSRIKHIPSDYYDKLRELVYEDTVSRMEITDPEKKLLRQKLQNSSDYAEIVNVLHDFFLPIEKKLWIKSNGSIQSKDIEEIETRSTIIARTTASTASKQLQNTAPGAVVEWNFSDLPVPSSSSALPQFHIKVNAHDAFAHESLIRPIMIENTDTGISIKVAAKIPIGDDAFLTLPENIINKGGNIKFRMLNLPPNNSKKPISTGISVDKDEAYILYKVGSFTGNIVKSLILILVLQAFLAAFAMFTASWLTFPVALLWCGMFYVLGLSIGFITDGGVVAAGNSIVMSISEMLIKGISQLLPDFSIINPVNNIVEGLSIKWSDMTRAFTDFILIRSLLALFAGGLILRARELARVITH